jgi:hypothetical protein
MRAFAFAVAAGVLVALPLPTTAAPLSTDLSSQSVQIGPGGVRVHDRYDSRRRDRVVREPRGGGQCAELRRACLNKERLGEQGEGNCRRYRALCRG